MTEESISPLEAFHNLFYYFAEELEILTWDAAKLWCWAKYPYIAGEIQWEMRGYMECLLQNLCGLLTESECAAIQVFLNAIERLPDEAIRGGEEALHHPGWEEIRRGARDLLERLARPMAENKAFFEQEAQKMQSESDESGAGVAP